MRTAESLETAEAFSLFARRLGSEGRGQAGLSLLAETFNAKTQKASATAKHYLSPDDVLWWSKLVKKTDYFVGDKDGRSIPFLGKPCMAIRIKRVKE